MNPVHRDRWIIATVGLMVATTLIDVVAFNSLYSSSEALNAIGFALIMPGFTMDSIVFGVRWQFELGGVHRALIIGGSAVAWTLGALFLAWAAMYVRRAARDPSARIGRFKVAAALALYLLLWAATATIGRSQVRSSLLREERDAAAGSRAATRPPQALESRNDGGVAEMPFYYADVVAPCPFLLRVDRGHMVAPLNGGGGREWHFWLLGLHLPLVQTEMWVS